MAKNERFKMVYSQGTLDVTQILVDTETGVNYMFHKVANAGGMTPLLDKDGNPVISPLANN
ncbi:MAG: xylan 1,4-beta-xylosidase [Lachnospiraceae bacterium]|nr:xylan 1,4-beta-xylosidase [Lachnospiraceae bacterium]